MTQSCQFRRVILGVHQSLPQQGLRLAAEVAHLLRAELCGLMARESDLAGLASFPFAREFRPLEGGWHALDLDRLSRDVDLAAERARRAFTQAASEMGLLSRLEVLPGSMAQAIASVSQAGDIVIVPEPSNPAERATLQFRSTVSAALGSAAAVMVVPPHIERRRGAVVAVAAAPQDESIEIAAALAALAGEELVVVEAYEAGAEPRRSVSTMAAPRRLRLRRGGSRDTGALTAALQGVRERLLVMTRGAWEDAAAAAIAVSRRAPVLVLEPSTPAASAAR
jgi:hypothetical protein